MNLNEFEDIFDAQVKRCQSILIDKAREYATDGDRLHNFKVAAEVRATTMADALSGMMVKHTVSIYDMINSDENFPAELWDEKITDHINYLILLRAIIQEESNAGKSERDGS